MNTKSKTLLLFLLFALISITVGEVNAMNIVVKGKTYEKKPFQNGSILFTNRTYVIENIPTSSAFDDYEFLASAGGNTIVDEGVIIPSSDGVIFVIAKSTVTIEGWTKVSDFGFTYDSGKTAMSVFQKTVTAGSEILIPQTNDFQGASPLAEKITYINPDLPSETTIVVEDKNNAFTLRSFVDGSNLFIETPVYRLDNVPENFSGFQFLASASNIDDEAIIVPKETGMVYVIAKEGGVAQDWDAVPNSNFFSDYSCDEMCIYQRFATAGERIELPKTFDLEGVSPLAKIIELQSDGVLPSTTLVAVEAEDGVFDNRKFENGAIFFTNRNYYIDDVPSQFVGFEFLASKGAESDEAGTILEAYEDGFLYVAARNGLALGNGWSIIPNTEFFYNDGNNTKLSIYQKAVNEGDRVTLPDLGTDFRGITPIAKKFIYGTTLDVRGQLIDVSTVTATSTVFPQNTTYKFPATTPAYLLNKKYAVSLVEYAGVSELKADNASEIFVALHYNNLVSENWQYTGDSFLIGGGKRYYVYKYQYNPLLEWINVPQPQGTTGMCTLVFADKIVWTNPQELPESVIITKSLSPKSIFITNPSLTILPDGDYIASCSGAYRLSGTAGTSVFLSSDKGKTWQPQVRNGVLTNYGNLFVHNDDLYIMGTTGVSGNVIIRKSLDKGLTWTEPVDANSGLLIEGEYHSAPVPVVVHNGRIWRAMETNLKGIEMKDAFVMSAPITADLMKASSWTSTNKLPYNTNWITGEGKSFKQWLEGNVVVNPAGQVVNILRVDEQVYDGVAAIATVLSPTEITFDPMEDIIEFPGGGKKFTIRYDLQSNKYWAISNAVFDEDRDAKHNGIYKNGIHCGLLRNRLVLMYSTDLRNWVVADTLVSYDLPFFYGFQYVDWQFDGNDIVAVSRTSFENEQGLPVRQHDANYFLFHRFSNFRKYTTAIISKNVKESRINYYNNTIHISLGSDAPHTAIVYDVAGATVYRGKETIIKTDGWNNGVYLVSVTQNGKTFSEKILIN